MNLKGRVVCSAVFSILVLSMGLAQAQKTEAVPGEYIVRLKHNDQMHIQSKEYLTRALGAYVKSTIPALDIVVVKRPVVETLESAIDILTKNPMVDIVEPNYIYKMNRTPDDPMLGKLWGLSNVGQKDSKGVTGTQGVDIDAIRAWDIETGSRKIIIAVIDTGIDFNHPDLKDNLWINEIEMSGLPQVDDDNNGVVDDIHGFNAITGDGNAMDDQGHGSHCSGTIGAKGNDGKGIVGVNWDTQLMAVKFLDSQGSGKLEDALKAIDYATKMGAKIMSNSWSGGGFSQTLLDAIERSNDAGALFIAAAGNEGLNNDTSETYPANYDVPNIISVAAIDNLGKKADFSNYGKLKVHLGAPGVNIYSSIGGSYDSLSGTSMATPHVSGVAALVWSQDQRMSAAEVKQRLMTTTRTVAGLRGKTQTSGIVNAYAALANRLTPPDLDDPAVWASKVVNVASASPYVKNTKKTYYVQVAGAKEISLYFEKFDTEPTYDTVQIIDSKGKVIQSLSGSNDGVFSASIKGNSAKIVFITDGSIEKAGWKITKAAYRK